MFSKKMKKHGPACLKVEAPEGTPRAKPVPPTYSEDKSKAAAVAITNAEAHNSKASNGHAPARTVEERSTSYSGNGDSRPRSIDCELPRGSGPRNIDNERPRGSGIRSLDSERPRGSGGHLGGHARTHPIDDASGLSPQQPEWMHLLTHNIDEALRCSVANEPLSQETGWKLCKFFKVALRTAVQEADVHSPDQDGMLLSIIVSDWVSDSFSRMHQSFAAQPVPEEESLTCVTMTRIVATICYEQGVGPPDCVEEIVRYCWEEVMHRKPFPQLIPRLTLTPPAYRLGRGYADRGQARDPRQDRHRAESSRRMVSLRHAELAPNRTMRSPSPEESGSSRSRSRSPPPSAQQGSQTRFGSPQDMQDPAAQPARSGGIWARCGDDAPCLKEEGQAKRLLRDHLQVGYEAVRLSRRR